LVSFEQALKYLTILGNTPVWSEIPGRLIQVDVSPAEVVWGVNSDHMIFLKDGTTGKWRPIPGLLKHVSVGNAGVWGVNEKDQIWYRTGVSPGCLRGTGWLHIRGEDN
jgi:uncharacterized protein (AIM24 family)